MNPGKQSGEFQRITGGGFRQKNTLLVAAAQADVPNACTLTDASLHLLTSILLTHTEIEVNADDFGWFFPGRAKHAEINIRLGA